MFSNIFRKRSDAVVVKEETSRKSASFSLEWTVKNFSSYRNQTQPIMNTGITMAELGIHDYKGRWRVRIIPCNMGKLGTGTVADSEKYVSVFLYLTDEDLGSTSYSGTHGILAKSQDRRVETGKWKIRIVRTSPDTNMYLTNHSSWGHGKLIQHSALFGSNCRDGQLKDDCITVIIKVTMFKDPETICWPCRHTSSSEYNWAEFAKESAGRLHPGGFIYSCEQPQFGSQSFMVRLVLSATSPAGKKTKKAGRPNYFGNFQVAAVGFVKLAEDYGLPGSSSDKQSRARSEIVGIAEMQSRPN